MHFVTGCRKSFEIGWERRGSGRLVVRGWQGKSAAFGLAHVVGGVEVLRRDERQHAVAALRNLKQINASRAVGSSKVGGEVS